MTRDAAWQVLPHEPSLMQLEENLWTIVGSIPVVPMPRRMVVVRLSNGELLLHNPIALSDDCMAALEALGQPRWMVIPNGYHRIDARRYKTRYPHIRVITPAGAVKRVSARVPVDMDYAAADRHFAHEPAIGFAHLPGIREAEGVMTVHSKQGATLVVNDAIFNLDPLPGLFGFIYGKVLGHTGRIQVPNAFRWVLLKDRQLFRENLVRLSRTPNLIRLIPGHGSLIDDRAAQTLAGLSATL